MAKNNAEFRFSLRCAQLCCNGCTRQRCHDTPLRRSERRADWGGGGEVRKKPGPLRSAFIAEIKYNAGMMYICTAAVVSFILYRSNPIIAVSLWE